MSFPTLISGDLFIIAVSNVIKTGKIKSVQVNGWILLKEYTKAKCASKKKNIPASK